MLQAVANSNLQMPHAMTGTPANNELRKYVFVADLMKVTGLGKYQAGEYFRKIKIAANIGNYVRSIHIDTFMNHLENECPNLKHITILDMRNVLV